MSQYSLHNQQFQPQPQPNQPYPFNPYLYQQYPPQFYQYPMMNPYMQLSQEQIMGMVKQMKEQGQLPAQVKELLEQQEQLQREIQTMQKENENIQQDIQKQQNVEEDRIKVIEQSIEQQKLEAIEKRKKSHNEYSHIFILFSSVSQSVSKSVADSKRDKIVEEGGDKEESKEEPSNENQNKEEAKEGEEEKEEEQENEGDKTGDTGGINERDVTVNPDSQKNELKEEGEKQVEEHDDALHEIVMLAAQGSDPTPQLEKENEELQQVVNEMMKNERGVQQKITKLEYENEILYGKSNSMGNAIHNYSKRVEEMNKQLEELNAIVRIKDQEMIEISNDIHSLKIQKEAMRKEILFRKQREEQLENNLGRVKTELERSFFEQEDLSKSTDQEQLDFLQLKEENKRTKSSIDEAKKETSEFDSEQDKLKSQLNVVNSQVNELESRIFSQRQLIDKLRSESEQYRVEISYQRANQENQKHAYDQLVKHYNKQLNYNSSLDMQRMKIVSKGGDSKELKGDANPWGMMDGSGGDDFDLARRDNFQQPDFMDNQKRSSSVENFHLQQRMFNPSMENQASQAANKVKKTYIDLSSNNASYNTSITGQNRRSTLMYIDGKANRNFIQQMPNILQWPDDKEGLAERKGGRMSVVNPNKTIPAQGRISVPDPAMDTSLRFGEGKKVDPKNSLYKEQEVLPQRFSKIEAQKVQELQNDLTQCSMQRDKIAQELGKLFEKSPNKEGRARRQHLEAEANMISSKINTIKMELRRLDSLNNY